MRLLSILSLSAVTLLAAPPVTEKPFAAGGKVCLTLEAGGYTLEASPDDRLRVRCEGAEAEQVRVDIDTRGAEADIDVRRTPRGHFRAVIQVPERTDLTIRMTAGELKVRGIVGHKDIKLRAGELDLAVPDPDAYRTVKASVWAGEICASPWRSSKGGLFRSVALDGPGAYDLRAKLLAGQITFRK